MEQGTRNKIFMWLEASNSILWFSMDSLWMFDEIKIATFLIIPTVLTGVASAFEKPDAGNISISMAVNCWLAMNIFWMLEMMVAAKEFFIAGIALVLLSVLLSGSLKVLDRFKRFRK